MKIVQCTTVLKFFKPHVFKKYGFKEYVNPMQPCVWWGCYPASRPKLISHRGMAVVVWRGSDAMVVLKQHSFVQFLKQNTGRIFHIAISNFIEQDLTKAGLPFISLPITSMDYTNCNIMPRGNMIYTYSPDGDGTLIKYHTELSKEIAAKTGIQIHVAHKNSFSRNILINKIYRDCFLGLRLLSHDGLPNSGIEMGLCGRRVVHNGNLPNSIPYTDTKSILQIVDYEFAHRKENNQQIAKDVENFINIDNHWLYTENYGNSI